MQNWTNLYLEPHDYRIHYVNIDLRHQYGISVAESQMFLRAKRPQRRRRKRKKWMFSQAKNLCEHLLSHAARMWLLAKKEKKKLHVAGKHSC